jgi:hypothetical protein
MTELTALHHGANFYEKIIIAQKAKKILVLLRKPKTLFCIHNSLQIVSILHRMSPIYTANSMCFKSS